MSQKPARIPRELVLYDGGSTTPTDVVDVSSGEIVSLKGATTDDLVALRVSLITMRGEIDSVCRAIDAEVIERMDKDAHWTHNVPSSGLKASTSSPEPKLTVLNPAELNKVLQKMLDQDEITPEAKFAAIEPKPIEYKVKIAGVKALLKRPDLRERLETVAVMVDKDRRVSYS